MTYGGSTAPCAYVHCGSIGVVDDGEKNKELSALICALLAEHCGVEDARVYIQFYCTDRHMFGWKSGTFAK